jgi:hypothetical protein
MSEAGYIKDDHYKFLLKYFPGNILPMRFLTLWNEVTVVINGMKIEKVVRLDEESLQMVILDYFTDIARLKDFQSIEHTNVNKIYAYTLYWFLKRHPVELIQPAPDNFDINEKVIMSLTMPKIIREAGIIYNKDTKDIKYKDKMNNFINLLFYNLKYRTYTPQSIELMIEAFLCGCECYK